MIATGGGAVAVTSSQEYLEKLRRYASLGSPYTELPDMNAALGIVQLAKIDMLLARRNEIYRMYLQSQLKSGSRLFGSASPLFTANGYGFSVIVKARPDDSIAFATSHSVSCRRTFTDSIGLAALIFIIIYTASFMMSWGPICWVLISEIFPNTIRGKAVAIAVAAQWISNFLVSSTFPSLSTWSVGGTYMIYAIFALLSAIFVWKWVPETKGKTLEDMSRLWKGK